jgi:N-acetylglucosamine-6-sulfatase
VRGYCRAITSADFLIGRVLEKIEEMGARENTIVIYAGDNGYLWGEHRLVDKRWAYEDSIRIPFLARYPRIVRDPGRPAEQMVLNVDVAPTILDLAGLPIPAGMQGRSFAPVLASRDAPGREAWPTSTSRLPVPAPGILAVRTPAHKYVEYEGDEPELFDWRATRASGATFSEHPKDTRCSRA